MIRKRILAFMTAIILSVAQITSSPLYGKDNSEKKDYVVVTKENSLSAIKKISAAYRAGQKSWKEES